MQVLDKEIGTSYQTTFVWRENRVADLLEKEATRTPTFENLKLFDTPPLCAQKVVEEDAFNDPEGHF